MRRVAICIWNGVELLDFAGPGEVFAAADDGRAFEVYTVAERADSIMSQGFVRIIPEYTIDTCPRPDIIVLPGGGTEPPADHTRLMSWLRDVAGTAELLLSVCTGAFLLAGAGLLDGLEATTWHGAIERLRTAAPRTRVHANRRFIDNGQCITSAGVSAGIDGALHVVQRLLGSEIAHATAHYMEYEWQPDHFSAPPTNP